MKKIIIITDVWEESTSGVVTVLKQLKEHLEQAGTAVTVIHPGLFRSIPLITYSEIRLALPRQKELTKIILEEKADYIHIATQGTLGLIARRVCMKHEWKFTTAFHTLLPDYVHIRFKFVSQAMVYRYLKWFHKPCQRTIVATKSLQEMLLEHGFQNVVVSPFGIDVDLFKANPKAVADPSWPKPIFFFFGRVAVEKNIRAFLDLDLPGTKLVIGDGPQRAELEAEYGRKAFFLGYKKGQDLVDILSVCDVFVFPSKTDTFGLVVLEAMACGIPVAAYDVIGPRDIIDNGLNGYLGDNLKENALKCLRVDRQNCRKKAMAYTWPAAAASFLGFQTEATAKD